MPGWRRFVWGVYLLCGSEEPELDARTPPRHHNAKVTQKHKSTCNQAEKPSSAIWQSFEAAGDKKIQVIKEVRALTNLGLGEAKTLVDGAPGVVLEEANKETAEKAKAALEEACGTVTLK